MHNLEMLQDFNLLFNQFNIMCYSDLDQFRNLHMGSFRNCCMLIPASFKLALMCGSCMDHLLPWVASCSLVMHHTWMSNMPCYVLCVYHVFSSFRLCFFSIVHVSLRSWGFVRLRLVRLRGFVFFMDSFFFLAGFQARWPLPWISLLSLPHLALFPLGFRSPRVIFILAPPQAIAPSSVGPNRAACGGTSGKLEVWFYS